MVLQLVSPLLVIVVGLIIFRIVRFIKGYNSHSSQIDIAIILSTMLLYIFWYWNKKMYDVSIDYTICSLLLGYLWFKWWDNGDIVVSKDEVSSQEIHTLKKKISTQAKDLKLESSANNELTVEVEYLRLEIQTLEKALEEFSLHSVIDQSVEDIEDQQEAMDPEMSHKQEVDPNMEDQSENHLWLDDNDHSFIDFTVDKT